MLVRLPCQGRCHAGVVLGLQDLLNQILRPGVCCESDLAVPRYLKVTNAGSRVVGSSRHTRSAGMSFSACMRPPSPDRTTWFRLSNTVALGSAFRSNCHIYRAAASSRHEFWGWLGNKYGELTLWSAITLATVGNIPEGLRLPGPQSVKQMTFWAVVFTWALILHAVGVQGKRLKVLHEETLINKS